MYVQDCAEHGSRVASSEKTLQFFLYVLFVILLLYVLDGVSITVYDRHTLLNIGFSIAQRKPDFWVLERRHFVYGLRIRSLCLGCTVATEETPPEKGEESRRPCQTQTPSPSTSSPNHFAG